MSNVNAVAPRNKKSRAPWVIAGSVGFIAIVHLIPDVRMFEVEFVTGFIEGFTGSYKRPLRANEFDLIGWRAPTGAASPS